MNRQIRSRVNYWDNWTNIRFTSKGQRPANYFFDSNDFEQMYVYSLFAQAHVSILLSKCWYFVTYNIYSVHTLFYTASSPFLIILTSNHLHSVFMTSTGIKTFSPASLKFHLYAYAIVVIRDTNQCLFCGGNWNTRQYCGLAIDNS